MNETLRKRVELGANVSIVLVSLLIGMVLIKDQMFNRPSLNQNSAAANPGRGPAPGQKVSLPDMDWMKNHRTLVLALSKGCRFCTESAEFYKKLASESVARSDLQLVVVLPQDVETGKSYLKEIGVPIREVRQAKLDSVGVKGTPTLMLVDTEGMVTSAWVGRLPPEKEAEVLERLR